MPELSHQLQEIQLLFSLLEDLFACFDILFKTTVSSALSDAVETAGMIVLIGVSIFPIAWPVLEDSSNTFRSILPLPIGAKGFGFLKPCCNCLESIPLPAPEVVGVVACCNRSVGLSYEMGKRYIQLHSEDLPLFHSCQ